MSRHANKAPSYGTAAKDTLSKKEGAHSTVYLNNKDTYMGEWRDNLRDGKGTQYYHKTKITYMGEWKNNVRHGFGTLSAPEASKTETNKYHSSSKNKPAVIQKLRKIYTGSWDCDHKHGLGTHFFADDSVYEGHWIKGMRQGWGRMTFADKSVYEGEWHHDVRHGQGILLLCKPSTNPVNGDRYEGMWFDDEKEGPGKFIYLAKRQSYSGEWSRGQPRCGMIQNLTGIPGCPGTLFDIPHLGLENPQKILDAERAILHDLRAQRLVGAE